MMGVSASPEKDLLGIVAPVIGTPVYLGNHVQGTHTVTDIDARSSIHSLSADELPLTILPLAGTEVLGQTTIGRGKVVQGTVTSPDGQPAPHVEVLVELRVANDEQQPMPIVLTTEAKGMFKLDGLPLATPQLFKNGIFP